MLAAIIITLLGVLVFYFSRRKSNRSIEVKDKSGIVRDSENVLSLNAQKFIKRFHLNPKLRTSVTLSANQGLLERMSLEDSNLLQDLNEIADFYVVYQAFSESEEHLVKALVSEKLHFLKNKIHFILFYESNRGKIAILRQIKPQIHIEYDPHIITEVSPHIRNVVKISSISKPFNETSAASINIQRIEDLLVDI